MINRIKKFGILTTSLLYWQPLWAFENAKVLPKGIRNITLKSASTTISGKTNAAGEEELLAKPLEKSITFDTIVKGESGLQKTLLRGFLEAEGFAGEDALLNIQAEMQANVRVFAPVLSYGASDNLTLALAIPFYNAAVSVQTGFLPTAKAYEFIERLDAPEHNLTASAKEVSDKLNNMDDELNAKLEKNGYHRLENWEAKGLGDIVLAGKYRFHDGETVKAANLSGFSLASGRLADPDVLTSIPFGKGAHQLFTGLIVDEPLPFAFTLNQYAKVSHPFPARANLRLKTKDEAIEVEKQQVKFALGDQLEAGASLQFEPSWGLVTGVGYQFQIKNKDTYALEEHPAAKEKWEENTFSRAHFAEAKFGYSAVNAFKRQEVMVPFTMDLEYRKFLAGVNALTNDLLSLNVAVFF